MAPLAFILPFLLYFGLSFAQDPIHIPLTRRSRVSRASDSIGEAYRLSLKYGLADKTTPVARGRRGRRASPVGVPIIDQYMDLSYLATITVGTPPQTFNVDLDTGSTDLWLADTSCLGCLLPSAPPYLPQQSTSFQGTGKQANISLGVNATITYGGGTAAGVSVADTVTMGGLKISSQIFLSANQVSSGVVDGSASGVMGLAFTALGQTHATPFWEALVNNNQLSSPEMSFWLNRSTDTQDIEAPGGVFTLGGTNSSLFSGDIEFHNITASPAGPTYWQLPMSAVSVDGQSVKISTGTDALAVIDTGLTFIGGPSADVKAIWEAVPGAAPSQQFTGYFEFPCTTVVNISLSFGGKLWPIDSQDMNVGQASQNNSCIGAIFDLTTALNIPGGSVPPWVVGDAFLKNVYSVFRASPPSVGFAQLSDLTGTNATGSATNSTPGANSTVSTKSSAPTGSSATHNGSTIFALLVSGLLSSIVMLPL